MVAIHSKHRNCTQHREERTRTSTSAGTTRASFVSGSSLRAGNATSSTRNERFAPGRMTPRIGWVHALYFTDPSAGDWPFRFSSSFAVERIDAMSARRVRSILRLVLCNPPGMRRFCRARETM